MTSYERNADVDPSALQGFQAYADDSPRDHEAPTAYATDDRWDEGDDDDQGAFAAPPPRRRWVGAVVLAGVVAFGAVAGVFLARDDGEPAVPATAGSTAEDAGLSVQVASMAETLTTPPPASGPKLEVLAPSTQAAPAMARRAPPPVQIVPSRAVQPSPSLEPIERQRESPVTPSGQDAAAVASATQPAFACSDAPTLARAMVCGDRRLAILDQRMKQAYAAALAAGASGEALREDQEDWLNVREDAAQDSRDTVAAVYRQRIAELRQLADGNF